MSAAPGHAAAAAAGADAAETALADAHEALEEVGATKGRLTSLAWRVQVMTGESTVAGLLRDAREVAALLAERQADLRRTVEAATAGRDAAQASLGRIDATFPSTAGPVAAATSSVAAAQAALDAAHARLAGAEELAREADRVIGSAELALAAARQSAGDDGGSAVLPLAGVGALAVLTAGLAVRRRRG